MHAFVTRLRSRLLPLGIILLAVALDILTKQLVVAYLKPIGTYPIIRDVFHLTYATNTGAAWSIFSAPDQRWIFMTISTVAILGMLVYLTMADIPSRLMQLGIGALIGGGIGNMIDRVSLGYVVDFLDARIINFPIFNVADCFITIGAGCLFVGLLLQWRREDMAARAAKEREADGNHQDQ